MNVEVCLEARFHTRAVYLLFHVDVAGEAPLGNTVGNEKSSAVTKLVRAAALAAMLVPLGSIAADGATITCGFEPDGGFEVCGTVGGGEGDFGFSVGDSASYEFAGGAFGGGYEVHLEFEQVNGPFEVSFENVEIAQGDELWDSYLANFSSHVCIPIAGADMCVFFRVDGAPGPGETTWEGSYDIDIWWAANTDGTYGDSPPGSVHLLHAVGSADDIFDSDITRPGSFFAEFESDPGIGGRGNNFTGYTVSYGATVPEPGTMLLMGSGLGSLIYRRRQRRNQRS